MFNNRDPAALQAELDYESHSLWMVGVAVSTRVPRIPRQPGVPQLYDMSAFARTSTGP